VGLLVREAEVLQLGQKIQNEARGEIEKVQREYFLREQMKAIQRELGEKDEQAAETEEFRKKIEEAKMPGGGRKAGQARVWTRLSRLPTAARSTGHSHLSRLLTRFRGRRATEDNLDISHAREISIKTIMGQDVKDRHSGIPRDPQIEDRPQG